jgi:hypothetical protein
LTATDGKRGALSREPRPLAARDGLVAAGLVTALLIVVASSRSLGFAYDDLFLERWSSSHGWWEILASPEAWRELPMKLLTPVLYLSFKLDGALGGGQVGAFRIHQLAIGAALASVVFLVLRLFFERWVACATTVLALGAPAVTGLVPLLMVRHYLEGLLCAFLAVGCFVLSVRGAAGKRWSLVSCGFWIVAALAKELFVPLPLVLCAMPLANCRERLRQLMPHLAVLAGYPFYRRFLLGEWLGGYGLQVEGPGGARDVFALPVRLLRDAASGGGSPGIVLASILAAAALATLLVDRRRRAFVVVLTAAALLPILPAARVPSTRLAAIPWVILALALPVALEKLSLVLQRATWVVVLGLLVTTHVLAWPRVMEPLRRIDAETEAFLRLGEDALLRRPENPAEAMFELARWKRAHLPDASVPGWYVDDLFLCTRPQEMRSIWQYDAAAGAVVERSERARSEARDYCTAIRREAKLEVDLRWGGDVVRWRFGPYPRGTYRLVIEEGLLAPEFPRMASFRRESGPLDVRVRYDSPEGWVTYSDLLRLEPEREVHWRRP